MDGLRGVLAVYVLLGHAMPFTDVPGWMAAPFRHGEAAVDLFFALSGLVMVNSLERFGARFWPFMAARARRLLPVYFVVLALSVALLAMGNPLPAMPWVGVAARNIMEPVLPPDFAWHLAAHVLLLQGVIPQGVLPYAYVTLLGPAWSLSTEWQFYVVMGLISPKRLGGFALGMLALGALYHLAASAAMVAVQSGIFALCGAVFRAGPGQCGSAARWGDNGICYLSCRGLRRRRFGRRGKGTGSAGVGGGHAGAAAKMGRGAGEPGRAISGGDFLPVVFVE